MASFEFAFCTLVSVGLVVIGIVQHLCIRSADHDRRRLNGVVSQVLKIRRQLDPEDISHSAWVPTVTTTELNLQPNDYTAKHAETTDPAGLR